MKGLIVVVNYPINQGGQLTKSTDHQNLGGQLTFFLVVN